MKSDLPRVSVIIPTFNRSHLLRVAVESALAQTYPNLEIIVVDDGSTDDTATVMAQYAQRVTYLDQANQDVAAARNTGFRASSGEYVTFLDDDDWILPTKIARQVQVLAIQPQSGLAHCGYYCADQKGDYLNKVASLPEGDVLQELVSGNFVWAGAPLIRRQCLNRVGLFDREIPSITADWDMWLRIAQAGYRFVCVQEPLGVYRVQPDSMMAQVFELERGMFAVLDKVFSNPGLPKSVVLTKDQVYGMVHFWVSCRHYAAGQWDSARRNLTQALTLCPRLLEQPEELSRLLCDDALSPRVGDPLQFVGGVLDHLPAGVDSLQRYRLQILGRIYIGLALKNYGYGKVADAKGQFAEAVALDPTRLEQKEDFAASLSHYAMHLPLSSPLSYVDTVLQNLPVQAQSLACVRPRVLSDVNIGCAFQDHYAGHKRAVIRRTLAALRYRPSWLRNRGVVSILLKSLLGLVVKRRPLREI